MPARRLFFHAGAATWIVGGFGHFALIDVLTLHGRTRVSQFIPNAEILDTMEKTTLSFGLLGSTSVFLATAGYSVWVGLSLAFLGVAYLLVGRQYGIALRPFARLGMVISATFCVVAATCFIFPATVGAAVATALFVASLSRGES